MKVRPFHIWLCLVTLIVPLSAAHAAKFSAEIDMNDPYNAETAHVYGHYENDRFGYSIASGDFNNDGREDTVVGAYSAQNGKGATYVLFGSTTFYEEPTKDLASFPSNVLRIYGRSTLDWSGWSVAVGKVNGDAYDDIIIGAWKADPGNRTNAGEVYVIYGASNLHTRGTIDLLSTSYGVTRIYGTSGGEACGYSVATGYVNGDSYADIIIGASEADPLSRINAGTTYVIYGSSSFQSRQIIDLNAAPPGVLRIHGQNPGDKSGYAVASGDLDGDNIDEIIIGAYGAVNGSGATYIIPGYADIDTLSTIDLASPPPELTYTFENPEGIVFIYGDDAEDHSGASLAIGNFNGDLYDDVIIGAPGGDPSAGPGAGETNVFFGDAFFRQKGTIYLGSVIGNMVRVTGSMSGEQSGVSAGAADLNGDGMDEILVGAPQSSPVGRMNGGTVYVIWGAANLGDRGLVDMTGDPEGVTRIYGGAPGDQTGWGLGGCDFDDDGFEDIVIGSYMADPPENRAGAGTVDILKGFDTTRVVSFSPADQQYVNTGTNIEMAFNSDLDSLYVDVFASYIGDITDTLYFDLNRAVFKPDTLFAKASYVNVTVNGINVDGEHIEEKQWTFYVKPDETPPRFVELSPEDGEVNVSPRANIEVTFSTDINRDSTFVKITGNNDRSITMAKTWADSILTLVNNNSFNLNEPINVEIDAGDDFGDRADTTWTFYVRPEATPPFFKVVHPGAPNLLPKSAELSILFPLDIDKSSVETLLEGSQTGTVPGTWAWSDTVYTFSHPQDFNPGETLNLVVTASDIHKNTISDSLFVFHVKPDEIPPSIISHYPEDGEYNVSNSVQILVEFSEDVVRDSTRVTVTTAKQGLKTMYKSWTDYNLKLWPSSNFLVDDVVTVNVSAGDYYANRKETTWTFRIRPETVPPYFTVKVPNSPSLMSVNDPISLLFPQDINKAKVVTTLVGSLNDPMPGTWAWSDTVYTFTPSPPYKPGYTLLLTVEAEDIHKNRVETTKTFNVKPDEIPPAIKSRTPEINQIDVPLAQKIYVNFTSDVVRDSTYISLRTNQRSSISFTKSWLDSTLTISPLSNFHVNETITVTINAGDLYGNRHISEWFFSTGPKVVLPYFEVKVPARTDMIGKFDTVTLTVSNKVDRDTVEPTIVGSKSGVLTETWTAVDSSYTFQPINGYQYGETLTLTVNAHDIYGNFIPEVTYSFKVKGDGIPPLIENQYPGPDFTNVAPADSVVIKFTQDVMRDSTTCDMIGDIQGKYWFDKRWDGSTLTLIKSREFRLGEAIRVSVATADTFSNKATYNWSFFVKEDLTPPTVTLDIEGDPNLFGFNQPISLVFSNDIDKESVEAVVEGSQSGVDPGEWSWYDYTLTFTPTTYKPNESLIVEVTGYDKSANPLPRTVYTFRVKGDETPPSILSIYPGDGDTGVYPDEDITIGFSSDVVPDSTFVTVTGSKQGVIAMQKSWSGVSLKLLNDDLFRLGEQITVELRTSDQYANRRELSWHFDIIPDRDPPIFRLLPAGDADNLSVNAPIILAFPGDVNKSTVTVSITGSKSGSLDGVWSWEVTDYTFVPAVNYEFGETITLVVNATDIYGNKIPETTETLKVGEHTPWLIITSVSLLDQATKTYRVNYTFSDPDNSYTKTRDWRISVDGGLWTVIPESNITNNKNRMPGDWYIDFRLPDSITGVYTNNARFRMEVYDGLFGSGWQVSPPFGIDLNKPPSVTVRSVVHNASSETVTVNYSLSDAESDSVSLVFDYSVDSGKNWMRGEPDQDLSNIPPNRYVGSFTWHYLEGLTEGIDYHGFRVRLTPSDYKNGTPGESLDVRIDLNDPPVLTLDDIYSTQSGDIPFTYHISDAEHDTVHVACFYSTNGGGIWHETNNVTGADNIISYTGSLVWRSKLDVPSIESFTVKFRAIPYDNDEGTGDDTEVFQIVNNGPPSVDIDLPDVVGNRVAIPYTITDTENDPVTLHIEWSDDAETWHPATVEGEIQDLEMNAYKDTVYWNSKIDLETGMFGDMKIRIYGTDTFNPPGSSAIEYRERTVTLDNEAPKLESVWGTAFTDIVYLRFNEAIIDSSVLNVSRYSLSEGLIAVIVDQDKPNNLFYLTLAEEQQLPYENITLTVTGAEDIFGNVSDGTSFEFLPEDDNDNPTVAITGIPAEVSGDLPVSFAVNDTEGDTVNLTVSYSTDNGDTWLDATVTGTITDLSPALYSGEFTWRTGTDLSDADMPDVLLRVTAKDKQKGEPFTAGPFRVDNNLPPTVSLAIADPDSIYSGRIGISYELTDAENDMLSIAAYYSLDSGETYHPATLFEDISGVTTTDYAGMMDWDTETDLADVFGEVVFKAVPLDNDEGVADSLTVWIDNFGACRVAVTAPAGEQTGDIPVNYQITDQHSRSVSLTVIYSTDGGETWDAALVQGQITGLGPASYTGSFIWKGSEQLNGYDGGAILKVIPNNGMDGIFDTAEVAVDYNAPPVVTLSPVEDEVSGDIELTFTVTDAERDTVSVFVEYSIDGGTNWYEIETGSTLTGIQSDGYLQTVVWNSGSDLPGRDITNVGIRITVYDTDTGNTARIDGVHVDNNIPPSVSMTVANPDSIYEDFVDICFTLSDPENNILGIDVLYSTNGGTTYQEATVTGTTHPIFSSGYESSVRWEIAVDTAFYGDAVVKIIPSDDDAGTPDSLTVTLNTYGVCSVAVSVQAGVWEEDIPVSYTINDTKNNPVSLITEYSTNTGISWNTASVTGSVTDIPPDKYTGMFTWRASENLAGKEGDYLLRLTPDNGSPGLPDTVTVSVDFNAPPTVAEVLSDTTQVYSGSMRISLKALDAENDRVKLGLEYSTDGGASYLPGTVTGSSMVNPGSAAEIYWSSFDDLGFVYDKSVLLRLTPSDNDPGERYVAGPFKITNLVGDFSFDKTIDGADLIPFITVWKQQDIKRETGPVTGTPPHVTVQHDGKVDFEDLTVFVWMWNWYSSLVTEKAIPVFRASESEETENISISPLSFESGGNGSITVTSDCPPDFLDIFISTEGDDRPNITADDNGYWSDGSGVFLTRFFGGQMYEAAAARFGGEPAPDGGGYLIGTLQIGRTAADVVIHYRVRFYGDETVIEGRTVIACEKLFVRPDTFSLGQNTPNPFNPSTTISFSLADDCPVSLTIRNISGQTVAVLADEYMYAGNYSIRWDASGMANGVYIYTLRAGEYVRTRKMILLK